MSDFREIDEHLENWRNYYRDRKAQRVTFSLEGKYRPKRSDFDYEDKEEEPITQPSKPVNVASAIEYEKAITELPFTNEACLVIEYMYKFALSERIFNKTCRIVKVSPKQWDSTVRKAKLMLMNKMQINSF